MEYVSSPASSRPPENNHRPRVAASLFIGLAASCRMVITGGGA